MGAFEDFKALEGARIQPLLAAVGAIPGAALVLSDEHSGAPIFVVALIFIAASYLMWMCSDAVFAVNYDAQISGDKDAELRTDKVGYYFSWATLLYGLASLFATVGGLAAMHSELRAPVTIEQGFLIAFGLLVVVGGHCVHSVYIRNKQNLED